MNPESQPDTPTEALPWWSSQVSVEEVDRTGTATFIKAIKRNRSFAKVKAASRKWTTKKNSHTRRGRRVPLTEIFREAVESGALPVGHQVSAAELWQALGCTSQNTAELAIRLAAERAPYRIKERGYKGTGRLYEITAA